MDSPLFLFAVLPFLLGGAVLVGLLVLARLMPGEGKAGPARVPAYGPDYDKLSVKRRHAFRIGWAMLVWLGFLTVAEIAAGLWLKSLSLLLIVNIVEAASILYVFMHIKTAWSSEEAH